MTWLTDLIAFAKQYEVLAGFLGASAVGTIMVMFRRVPRMIFAWFLYLFTVELTAYAGSPVFDWLDLWIAAQPNAAKARRFVLGFDGGRSDEPARPPGGALTDGTKWRFLIGAGFHLLWYRGRPIFVARHIADPDKSLGGAPPRHTLFLRTIGRSHALLKRIMGEAEVMAATTQGVAVYRWVDHYWQRVSVRSGRDPHSVVLKGDQVERIIADAQKFSAAKERYAIRGIPWRLGYLFHGRPGTGKSSMAMALATILGKPIYVLHLSALGGDMALLNAMANVSPESVLLVEDVDNSIEARKPKLTPDLAERMQEMGERFDGVSLAMFLNTVDGIDAGEGRILVMTSNHPEPLDAALIRPGRVDKRYEFALAGNDEAHRMFARFFPDFTPPHDLVSMPVSPAALQGELLAHQDSPLAAIQAIRALCHEQHAA